MVIFALSPSSNFQKVDRYVKIIFPEFLKSIGMEADVEVDDVSDVSFDETDNDHMTTPRGPPTGNGEEPTTPRKGILKIVSILPSEIFVKPLIF